MDCGCVAVSEGWGVVRLGLSGRSTVGHDCGEEGMNVWDGGIELRVEWMCG